MQQDAGHLALIRQCREASVDAAARHYWLQDQSHGTRRKGARWSRYLVSEGLLRAITVLSQ